jgi:hypothetical protein
MNAVSTPQPDAVDEARRVLAAATVPLRVLGGVGIALSLEGAPLLPRTYNDIDFITARGEGPHVARLFEGLGYAGDHQFNGLNGHRRLLFYDTGNERRVDVFVGQFQMSHSWPLERRLTIREGTLPPADLLLTKLQIYAVNEKDQRDLVNLVHGHELTDDERGINVAYTAKLCASDWGLWRTSMLNMERVRAALPSFGLGDAAVERVTSRLDELERRLEAEPKSTKWKLRARVGERMQWYEEPEEVG